MYQFQIPNIRTTNGDLDRQINSVLRQLVEQLNFWISNIDEDNLNDSAKIPIRNGGTGGTTQQEAFEKLVAAGGRMVGNLIFEEGKTGSVMRDGSSFAFVDYGTVNNTLWTGALSVGGSITIPEANSYRVFMVATSTNETPFFLLRNGARIAGGSLFSTGGKSWVNAMAFTISGDTITYTHNSVFSISSSTGSAGDLEYDNKTITKFVGII